MYTLYLMGLCNLSMSHGTVGKLESMYEEGMSSSMLNIPGMLVGGMMSIHLMLGHSKLNTNYHRLYTHMWMCRHSRQVGMAYDIDYHMG